MAKGSGGTRGAAGGAGGSRGLERALSARMKEIQKSDDEHVSIFDANGKELFKADGNEKSVSFDDDLAKNHITVHNHPGDSTFSYDDIEAAVSTNQKEMHVITQSGSVYSLKRPKKGWGISTQKLHDVTNDVGWKVSERIGKSGKNISMDEAVHMQWQALSKKLGWSYSKTKLK